MVTMIIVWVALDELEVAKEEDDHLTVTLAEAVPLAAVDGVDELLGAHVPHVGVSLLAVPHEVDDEVRRAA
ncbi:hypothetical protein [Streptomyces sp. NPDC003710]